MNITTNMEDVMRVFKFTEQDTINTASIKASTARQNKDGMIDGPLHLDVKAVGYDVAANVPVNMLVGALAGLAFHVRGQVMSVAVEAPTTGQGKAVEVMVIKYAQEGCPSEQWEAMATACTRDAINDNA